MYKIAIVEDEESILEVVKFNLELENYVVDAYVNGSDALQSITNISQCDLLILDVMLPGINGLELCEKIRAISNIPILFLSAKGNTSDKILGLKSGANDYLSKPFDLEELLLRVQILLQNRKPEKSKSEDITIGNKHVNFQTYEVTDQAKNVAYTFSKKELDLLKYFIEEEGRVVSRDEILDHVWGKDQYPNARTIDNFVLNFRKLFETDSKEPKYFQSIRGVGYKFDRH
jgi:two-component system alkaline phosphatase synthesis response regulator PhoP